jgi:phosphate transport system substrate-binding protein
MKTSFRFLVAGLLVTLNVAACVPASAPTNGESLQGEITVSGAFALYPLMLSWSNEFQKAYPSVKFEIASGGAGKGMEDILAQKVDIGMVSREITPAEEIQGAYPIVVAKDAVFPMISSQNPVLSDLLARGVSHETLVEIFITGKVKTWGQVVGKPELTDEIHVYTRSETCGAAETWGMYLGGDQTDLLGDGRFGDTGIIRALVNDPQGIGYSNQIYAYGLGNTPPTGVLVLPIDLNGNMHVEQDEFLDTRQKATVAVASGIYPAPPSRFLYLVTNGKPDGVIQAFLEWILLDGQSLVDRLGYVQLPDEQLDVSLQRVR